MSKENRHSTDSLRRRISSVSSMAARFGHDIGFANTAETCALLYSFGRYGDASQAPGRVAMDYSIPGAAYLYAFCDGKRKVPPLNILSAIEVIAGHRDGLQAYEGIQPVLDELMEYRSQRPTTNKGRRVSVVGREYLHAIERFLRDFPKAEAIFRAAYAECPPDFASSAYERMLLSRMLLSCLVDADATAAEENGFDYAYLMPDDVVDSGAAEISLRKITGTAKDNALYECCREKGRGKERLLSVAAPAGKERSLAMLSLAVSKCKHHNRHNRIIAVLPSLELVEESAKIYKKVFPNLIVDCGRGGKEEETEAWDAPCVITSAKVFFESLFSSNRTACRKLHRIANSVVIFEDIQTVPAKLLPTTLKCIQTLTARFGVCFAMASATNPDLGNIVGSFWAPSVIWAHRTGRKAPNVSWEQESEISSSQLADETVKHRQVCVLVNTREQARSVFERWEESAYNGDVFMMTSDLCPAHRRAQLEDIRERLASGRKCKVVSTQVLEQSDLIFPVIYRAMAPLPELALASNMCRLGQGGGELHIFSFTGKTPEPRSMYPCDEYANATMLTRECLARTGGVLDLEDPETQALFYARPFIGRQDKPFGNAELDASIAACDYSRVSRLHSFTPEGGFRLIVPYGESSSLYDAIQGAMTEGQVTRKLLQQAEDITVTVYAERDEIYRCCIPICVKSYRTKEDIFSGVYLLKREKGNENYAPFSGVSIPSAHSPPVPDSFSIL